MILKLMVNRIGLQDVVLKKCLSLCFFWGAVYFLFFFHDLHAQGTLREKKSGRPSCSLALKDINLGKKVSQSLPKECVLVHKIFLWQKYRKDPPEASFSEIVDFINQNPTWPNHLLKKRAEKALNDQTPAGDIIKWFSKNAPLTAKGGYYYACALESQKTLRKNQKGLLPALVQKIWHSFDFEEKKLETKFLKRFRKFLGEKDHLERLNRLIVEEKEHEIPQMKKFLGGHHHKLIDVRLAFLKNVKVGELLFKKLPTHLKTIPGLIHDRIKFLIKEERYEEVYPLLKQNLKSLFLSASLWKERHIFVRDAFRDGWHGREIYQALLSHGLESGGDFSDAEFLLGFVALTSLKKPKVALNHFEKIYAGVERPISKTRAAYWAGRAAEAAGEKALAVKWYQKAAKHPTLFYGQEALIKLKKPLSLKLLNHFPISPQKRKSLEAQDLMKAITLLKENGLENYLPLFLEHAAENAKNPEERAFILELTNKVAPHLCVPITRVLVQRGDVLLKPAYPLIAIENSLFGEYFKPTHKAFALSIIRKESSFNEGLVSSKGATGLMQIKPETAQDLISKNKLNFSGDMDRCLKDPKKNLKLGCTYLDNLFELFDGSLYLVAAAYNAGPGTLEKWLERYGDPREKGSDIVAWIESLPYGETRNYIHRVIEATRVYQEHFKSIQKRPKEISK
ncbi:MAG: lytic transglycosylase domain-containing protein [Proteobacteria bacterium]|nr:lytic transglycosylase domain-containing protein [Pseudomonadota bacterium]